MLGSKTVYDLCFLALREIGVVSLGDSVDNAVAQEALLVLNGLRAEYSLGLKNYKIYDQTFTAVGNITHVVLGALGDIPIRPSKIDQITAISGDPGVGVNYPVVLRPYESYQQLPVTNIFAIPQAAYIDTGFPQQNVWLYPGLASGWSIRIMGMSYMPEYENLSDPYSDPPEWWNPLYLNLALRMAPKYGVDLPMGVVAQAQDSIKHVKANMFMSRLKPMPNGLGTASGSLNFYSGV